MDKVDPRVYKLTITVFYENDTNKNIEYSTSSLPYNFSLPKYTGSVLFKNNQMIQHQCIAYLGLVPCFPFHQ